MNCPSVSDFLSTENFNNFFFNFSLAHELPLRINLFSVSHFSSTENCNKFFFTENFEIFFNYSPSHELPVISGSTEKSVEVRRISKKKYTIPKVRYVLITNVSTENVILRSLEKSYGEFLK